MTRRASATGLLALALVVGVATTSCSKHSRPKAAPATTTTAKPPPTTVPAPVHFTITETTTDGSDPPSDDVVAKVNEALDRYVATAIVAPLSSGQPVADLSPAFTAAAVAQIGADADLRATVLDEGMPPASREISASRATAVLEGVNDPGGTAIVGARIGLTIHAAGPGLDVDIARDGELVFVPDGDAWKINVVHLQTQRNSR
ncbi:MAG TPA: hypothetical protein VHN98_09840 [Acidimicrobiales bacterium]|nr:hypothetical protein [Acidimicrobiales bacterium]